MSRTSWLILIGAAVVLGIANALLLPPDWRPSISFGFGVFIGLTVGRREAERRMAQW